MSERNMNTSLLCTKVFIGNSSILFSRICPFDALDENRRPSIFHVFFGGGIKRKQLQQSLEVLSKKVISKVPQNSQGNNCARVFFLIKFFIEKRDSGKGVFL